MATSKRRKKNDQDDAVNGNSWWELHPDLLTLVFSRLSFVDQPAFLCVCKSWRSAALAAGEQHIKQLWLIEKVVFRERNGPPGYCPYNFVNYSSHDKRSYIRDIPCLSHCSFLAAKHGWMLVGRRVHATALQTFFYDPFSHTIIDLPTPVE